MTPRIAVYSPTLSGDETRPSGERTILDAAIGALDHAGFRPEPVPPLRTLDKTGDPTVQGPLGQQAADHAAQLIAAWKANPPALWYTYHCYYKCPDMVGPVVARALEIPYVIQQPSLSPRRLDGPWSAFARACGEALRLADLLLWSTPRDVPALEEAGFGDRMRPLPPVLPGPLRELVDRAPGPPTLLTVAMMRPGDKLESYRRLAAALALLPGDWHLRVAGDGPVRSAVEEAFAPLASRVSFLGALDAEGVAAEYRRADAFLWPGVGEGVGMVYLEAQAHGVPVVAEDHPALEATIENRRAIEEEPDTYAALITETLGDLPARRAAARARVEARHTVDAAAAVLRRELGALL